MNGEILTSTAKKISAIKKHVIDRMISVVEFEDGTEETFLDWFFEKHKPEVGQYIAKDHDGFTRVVAAL